jgi:hypothetical protein
MSTKTKAPTFYAFIPLNRMAKAITDQITRRNKVLAFDHTIAVSAIHHFVVHGNDCHITKFYNTLPEALKSAFRLYLKRIEVDESVKGKWIIWSQKELRFKVVKASKNDEAKAEQQRIRVAVQTLCEQKLLNPDGVEYKRFFERDIHDEIRKFANDDVEKGLKALKSRASGDNDKVQSTVSPAVQEIIDNAISAVHTQNLREAAANELVAA